MTLPSSGLRVALLAALALLLAAPAVAAAHASLVSSDPSDGDTISGPPDLLTATFSEALSAERSRIVVRDAGGNEIARGGVTPADTTVMEVDLSGVAPGDYVARWTAVTPDDNGITRGTIDFTIAAAASPSPTPSAPPTVDPSGSPTPPPSASPTAPATPTASPTPTAAPSPPDGQPTTGTGDLLVALAVAGVLVGALLGFLWRRRAA